MIALALFGMVLCYLLGFSEGRSHDPNKNAPPRVSELCARMRKLRQP